MTEMISTLLGLGVGLSLGALGGGGSTLAVPILVFVAGLGAQDATTASLLVVGVASAFGVVSHHRNGNVRFGTGLAFGAAGIVGSRVGLLLNRSLPEAALLLSFSVLIVFVAARMYLSAGTRRTVPAAGDLPVDASHGPARIPLHRDPTALLQLFAAASAVGLLTGLFGVGGGFAVVPALTLLLKIPTKEAIGTSLVVIVINAGIALTMRSGDIGIDWAIVAPFLATVTAGVIVGTRIARGVDADRLTRAFAVMLGAVAVYTAASTVLAA